MSTDSTIILLHMYLLLPLSVFASMHVLPPSLQPIILRKPPLLLPRCRQGVRACIDYNSGRVMNEPTFERQV